MYDIGPCVKYCTDLIREGMMTPPNEDGELPELDMSVGVGDLEDAPTFFEAACEAADREATTFDIVPAEDWDTKGAGYTRFGDSETHVRVKRRDDRLKMSMTALHEAAHAMLHEPGVDRPERKAREAEAEAAAYVVGRHFGLEVDRSAEYLAAWTGDDPEVLTNRLKRISDTGETLIESVRSRL